MNIKGERVPFIRTVSFKKVNDQRVDAKHLLFSWGKDTAKQL